MERVYNREEDISSSTRFIQKLEETIENIKKILEKLEQVASKDAPLLNP